MTAQAEGAETTPEDALSLVRGYAGPLLIDFDETLYLRNSTEDFIDCALPAPLALFVLRILDLIAPWTWTGGAATRDSWRVGLIVWLFPWTRRRWRRRANERAGRYRNDALADALAARGRTFTIVTLGFASIVEPLVAAMELGDHDLIACRSMKDRLRGKSAMVQARWGDAIVASAAAITDSEQDAALLRACKRPALTRWPSASFVPALRKAYLPGQYLDTIKRPRTGALKDVLVNDFPLWVLASLPFSLISPWSFLGLACLFVSFWAVYEIGYIENDMVAANYEAAPQLTRAFQDFDPATVGLRPWIYAVAFAALGILLLRHIPWANKATDAALWAAALAVTRLYFRVYNFADKQTRAWLYLGLQVLRVAAFAAVAPLNVVGAFACAARAISRWQMYYMYRQTRDAAGYKWIFLPERTIAFVLFLLLFAMSAFAGIVTRQLLVVGALFVVWNSVLVAREIKGMPGVMGRVETLRSAFRKPDAASVL